MFESIHDEHKLTSDFQSIYSWYQLAATCAANQFSREHTQNDSYKKNGRNLTIAPFIAFF